MDERTLAAIEMFHDAAPDEARRVSALETKPIGPYLPLGRRRRQLAAPAPTTRKSPR
jgi:hypothetical protein